MSVKAVCAKSVTQWCSWGSDGTGRQLHVTHSHVLLQNGGQLVCACMRQAAISSVAAPCGHRMCSLCGEERRCRCPGGQNRPEPLSPDEMIEVKTE